MKNSFAIAAMAAIVLTGVSIAATWADDKPAASAERKFKPYNDVETLMEGQEQTFSRVKSGIKDTQWDQAYIDARLLAELANVNVFHATNAEYAGMADSMMDACDTLAKSLKKKDVDASKSALTAVADSCKACHNKFK